MTGPAETSQPRLAAGCRWSEASGAERVLLFPEGAIRLQGTGRQILELSDGQRTVQQIVEELLKVYGSADPEQIRREVGNFLETLHRKRIVDY